MTKRHISHIIVVFLEMTLQKSATRSSVPPVATPSCNSHVTRLLSDLCDLSSCKGSHTEVHIFLVSGKKQRRGSA